MKFTKRQIPRVAPKGANGTVGHRGRINTSKSVKAFIKINHENEHEPEDLCKARLCVKCIPE